MPREVILCDLEAMNSLIDANVDERSLWVDLPSARVLHLEEVGA